MTKTSNKGLQITVDPEIASELAYRQKLLGEQGHQGQGSIIVLVVIM